MSNSNVEYVLSKTLNDFIDEHETISYDIISELNKFDQYVADRKQAAFPSDLVTENSVNIKKFMSAIQNNKIVMDYADYTWNCKGLTMYNCKLCKDSVIKTATAATLCKTFATIDDFLDHVQKLHARNIEDVLKQQIADKKSEQLWAGELEKMKNTKYIRHSEEFLQEIDKILNVEDSNMNGIANSINNHKTNENDMKSKISCSSGKEITLSSLSTAPTNLTMNSCDETMEKKKKKRTSGQCDVCNRTFNDLYNLRIHKMIHTGERPFQCEECGKRFRQYNKLKNHCITHTNEKPHICDTCGKGFRFRNYLSVHKRLHSGENPYKCNFCEEYFHSLHAKRLHTKILHCETETFTCPICAKVLTAQCYLTAHIKRHTNQRDYKCEICNKCFFSQSQLKDHQLVHTNLKPYQCSVCGSRFQRKSNYTQHLKIHTGEKTYVCNICYKSFAQNAGLYGHIKSHTK